MLPLLFLAATAYGAAIPPTGQSCLEKCLVTGGIVGAAADLNYFKSVAVDINNFCNVYTSLLKCAAECSQDDLNLVIKHTLHASFICKEKMEEVKTVHDCLESDTNDPLTDCSKVCEVTEHVPLRLDSTATAPVNPNVPAEGTGPLCEKQLCVVKCAREQLNKQCAGSGDLFKEVARHQVEVGRQMLTAQSENTNDTASQMVALSYLANVPEKCGFLTNPETFDKMVSGDSDKKDTMIPTDFSNDTASDSESPLVGVDLFDPLLFEFAPALEPDLPTGRPTPIDESSDVPAETAVAPSQPEEDVKVIGDEAPMVPGATAIDAPSEGVEKVDGEHDQPKPAEVPGETSAAMDEEAETAEGMGGEGATSGEAMATPATAESDDKESEMAPRPTVEGGGSGLIPSRPVTEEDKDKEEEETDEVAHSEDASAGEGTMPAVGEVAADEAAEGGEETAATEGESNDEEKSKEDSEGSEMATDAVIVVDDDKQIDTNEVTPVTPAQQNGSSSAMFLSSLLALVYFIM